MTDKAPSPRRILVIKLGALGDFVQACGPFAAIRRHHPGAHIVLLTGPAFADFARSGPYFDEVWIDRRPRLWHIGTWLSLRRRMLDAGFDRVYDLQTSERTGHYFRLLGPGRRPEWSGAVAGCSHPHANPDRDRMHSIDRQAEQLRMAGIADVPLPDLTWVHADIAPFGLRQPYVLIVPGGSAHRPAKRWPAASYAALCRRLIAEGRQPVALGTEAEVPLIQDIAKDCPGLVSLAGKTGFADIVMLARGAESAVGNDTGPMHLIAAAGCRSVVLFSGASDPALCAPRGAAVAVLRRDPLADLPVPQVWEALTAPA